MYMFKALVWVPWLRNVLASGGGVGDGCICLTNAVTGQRISTVDTNTQVRAIIFTEVYTSRQSEIQEQVLSTVVDRYEQLFQVCCMTVGCSRRELISGHGAGSCSVIVWRLPQLQQLAQLHYHSARVLSLAISPSEIAIGNDGLLFNGPKTQATSVFFVKLLN